MPTAADVAWIDVLPSMRNFLPTLRKEANSAASSAGGAAGRQFGQSFGDSAKASVEAAQGKLVAAQKKAADATGALGVAEARLQDIRKRSSVSAGTLAAAEERVAKAQRTIELQTSGVARAERDLGTATAYANREAQGFTGTLQRQSLVSKAFSGTVSALGTIVRRAWLPVSVALGAAGTVGVRTAAQLEQSRVAFTNMLGSATAADKFLKQLANFAARTPFEFTDVTRASQRLMAMGIAADDVIPYLTAIGDAVSAMGGGKEQIDQVTTAIGQMAAKGRIQSDELLQLTEAGIPALKILASEYGVTTGEMQDMITAGTVMSADALPKLIHGMENGTASTQAFGGMMAEQSKSLTGLWSTFKDTVSANLAQAFLPLIPYLKSALSGATDLTGQWLSGFQHFATTLVAQIPNLFAAIAQRDAQGIGEVIDNILGNTGRYVDTFRSIAAGVIPFVGQLWQLFTNVWRIAGDLGPVLGVILGGGLRLVWEGLNLLLPLAVQVTGWLADNKPVVIALASAWAALIVVTKAHAATMAIQNGAMVAWLIQSRLVQAASAAWAAVQWVLNSALLASPITWVVVGLVALGVALYQAWTHSETFRNIVMGALHAVADAGVWMWEKVLRPTWAALVAAWNGISAAVQWAWSNVIQPVWNVIATAAQILFAVVAAVLITPWLIAWNVLTFAIQAAWTNILQPTWNAIAAVAGWLWTSVLQPTWAFMQAAWAVLLIAIGWYWDNVLHPVWVAIEAYAQFLWMILQGIWAGMQAGWTALVTAIAWAWDNILHPAWVGIEVAAHWLWENVLTPIWNAMQAAWTGLVTAMLWAWDNILHPAWQAIEAAANWLWNNVLSPVFGAIGAAWDLLVRGIRWVYDNVLHPVWQIIKDAVHSVQTAFETVRDGIRWAWDQLMDIVSTPVNFVIEVIFNRGLFTAWNWVVDHLPGDLPKAPHWDQLPRGTKFAEGGKIPGWSPTPVADNIPIWATAGEFMQPVPTVDHYGTDAMEAVRQRKAAIYYAKGGQIGAVPGFATGGQLFNTVAAAFPGVRFTSGYRPGDPGYHGKNQAADIGGPSPTPNGSLLLASIEQWIAAQYGKGTTELIYDGAGNRQADLYHGAPHTYSASTQRDHYNHVHWAMAGALASAAGAAGGGAGIISNAGAEAPWYETLWGSVTGAYNWFKDSIKAVGELVGKFGDSPFVKVAAGMPGEMLGGLWNSVKGAIGDLFTSVVGGNTLTSGTGRVQDDVKIVFNTRGWGTGAQWDATNNIVQKESGWNPKAQNPTSSASGLFQHIDGTWRAYRPPTAAAFAHMKDASVPDQAQAGMRYIGARYGDPIKAWAYWQANHHYAQGGQVSPYLLDAGGLWPHGSLGLNLAGGDERVLTPGQDDYWKRFVDVSDRVVDVGGGRRALIERVEINVRDNDTAYQAIDELEHRLRVADLGGRYAWTSAP